MPSLRHVFNLALFAFAISLVVPLAAARAAHPCDPPNIVPGNVCGMDSFRGSPPREIPNGWNEFVLSGDLTYMQDSDSAFGEPSLRMWSSGGTFKAGIYTQIPVSPGAGYRASIAWGAPDPKYADTFGRQLGIDPTGGTDPNASTVVWGPVHWGPGRILNYPNGQGPNIDVTARAQGSTMTVFFVVDHPRSTGDNLIFIDAIALFPDDSAAAAPANTPVPAPATSVPQPTLPPPVVAQAAPSTATPTATLSPTPSPTVTSTPSATTTPTATSSPTATATNTATPNPTATPSPTLTPTATPTPGLLERLLPSSPGTGRRGGLLPVDLLGGAGFVLAGGTVAWLIWRRRV